MADFESLILLMCFATLLVSIAERSNIPYPIVLVVGGGLLSFLPGLDFTYIDPNLLLAVVLPPILYYAAFWTSFGDFKKHFREISSLAISLVIITTIACAMLFKWCFPHYSWALAFAFGAIVSPPDAAAATSVLKRFPIGHKLTAILEGESLVNDASALVLYKIAVIALVSGTFSLVDAGVSFIFMSIGGIALGICFGYIVQTLSRRFLSPVVGAMSSFLIPYTTYILATFAGVSSILAVVACGIVASRVIFKHPSSLRRMIGRVTWDLYIIVLNCFIFVLIGSQLDEQTSHMSWHEVALYSGYAFLIFMMMSAIRLAWVTLGSVISMNRHKNKSTNTQTLREGVIIGWSSMRGIVSLTAALALPFTNDPGRAETIFVTFCVILYTLIIPGLTLTPLIAWLELPKEKQHDPSLETKRTLAQVALDEINRLHSSQNVTDDERSFLYDYFNNRYRLWELLSPENMQHKHIESVRTKVVQAQRKVLLQIWEHGTIDDKVLDQIQHDLDAEETRTPRAEI